MVLSGMANGVGMALLQGVCWAGRAGLGLEGCYQPPTPFPSTDNKLALRDGGKGAPLSSLVQAISVQCGF